MTPPQRVPGLPPGKGTDTTTLATVAGLNASGSANSPRMPASGIACVTFRVYALVNVAEAEQERAAPGSMRFSFADDSPEAASGSVPMLNSP